MAWREVWAARGMDAASRKEMEGGRWDVVEVVEMQYCAMVPLPGARVKTGSPILNVVAEVPRAAIVPEAS